VLVRATVGDRQYWMDGTRLGDRRLADLETVQAPWALPLRIAGATLERVSPTPPRYPQLIQAVDIDASTGFDKPGRYRVQDTLRGDEIFGIRAQLAGVAQADANRMLASYWRQRMPDVEPSQTSWRFDEDHRLLILSMTGEGKVDWEGDDKDGHTHYLFGGGFPPPAEMKRPKDQPQDAAYATDYPAFTCYATTVRVPAAGKGRRWAFNAKPVNRTLGGVDYWRASSFANGVAQMVKSRRVDVREISAADAAGVNGAIKTFDNNKSYVYEAKGMGADVFTPKASGATSLGSFDDFAGAAPPCQAQVGGLVR
jgi:hypothetical protein